MPPPREQVKPKFPVPWGLFVVLGVYGLALIGYVYTQYWSSPEYVAAQKYGRAVDLLGLDMCAKCSEAQMNEAMVLLLEASQLQPAEKWFPEQIEHLRWQFDLRKFKLSKDLQRKAEFVSANTYKEQVARQAVLVIGARDRGWAPEQVLKGPQRALLWGIPGAALIIAFWAYLRFAAKKVRHDDHEKDLKDKERELEDLGKFRDGLEALKKKQAPLKTAGLQPTLTPKDVPAPRRVTGRRPAIKSGTRPALSAAEPEADTDPDPAKKRKP